MFLTPIDLAAISLSPIFNAVSLGLIKAELEFAAVIELAPAEVLLGDHFTRTGVLAYNFDEPFDTKHQEQKS